MHTYYKVCSPLLFWQTLNLLNITLHAHWSRGLLISLIGGLINRSELPLMINKHGGRADAMISRCVDELPCRALTCKVHIDTLKQEGFVSSKGEC